MNRICPNTSTSDITCTELEDIPYIYSTTLIKPRVFRCLCRILQCGTLSNILVKFIIIILI